MNTFLLRLVACLFLSVSLNSFGALSIRDLDGNLSNGHEGVYDDVLNVTWLANANLAQSTTFGISINSNGSMTNAQTELYVVSANVANYLGHSAWRLPNMGFVSGVYNTATSYDGSSDRGYNIGAPINLMNPNGQSTDFLGNELAFMYYQNLGGLAKCLSATVCLQDSNLYGLQNMSNERNLELFSSISPFYYRSKNQANGGSNFGTSFNSGLQVGLSSASNESVWLVHDGDIGAAVVPIPAAAWLFGSALAGLLIAKRKRS
ncbi:DUF1566 domain-containing protein [Pseudomonadales bacterium]|nr:DUF1566 domain-containing protein [Pseudomonadales bacterium]